MLRRARLQVTVAEFPTGINYAGIYYVRGTGTVGFRDDTTSVTTSFGTYAAPGSAAPSTSTLPSGDPAVFQSASGEPLLRSTGYSRAKAKATTSSPQSISTDSETTATLDEATVDTDSYFASNYLAAPYPGQYLVMASVNWEAGSDATRLRMQLDRYDGASWGNNEGKVTQPPHGGETNGQSMTQIVTMDDDERVRIRVYHDDTGSLNLTAARLSAIYLGPTVSGES